MNGGGQIPLLTFDVSKLGGNDADRDAELRQLLVKRRPLQRSKSPTHAVPVSTPAVAPLLDAVPPDARAGSSAHACGTDAVRRRPRSAAWALVPQGAASPCGVCACADCLPSARLRPGSPPLAGREQTRKSRIAIKPTTLRAVCTSARAAGARSLCARELREAAVGFPRARRRSRSRRCARGRARGCESRRGPSRADAR